MLKPLLHSPARSPPPLGMAGLLGIVSSNVLVGVVGLSVLCGIRSPTSLGIARLQESGAARAAEAAEAAESAAQKPNRAFFSLDAGCSGLAIKLRRFSGAHLAAGALDTQMWAFGAAQPDRTQGFFQTLLGDSEVSSCGEDILRTPSLA